jgi:hypothetical protein
MNTIIIKLKRVFPLLIVVVCIVVAICQQSNKFAFSPIPQNGKIGRFAGVYVYENGEELFGSCKGYAHSYNVLRFYNDGIVLDASICLNEDIIKSWSDIKTWLKQDTDNQTIRRGEYFVSESQIWFRTAPNYDFNNTTPYQAIIDYSGIFSENEMTLNLYAHYITARVRKDIKYIKVDVEQ